MQPCKRMRLETAPSQLAGAAPRTSDWQLLRQPQRPPQHDVTPTAPARAARDENNASDAEEEPRDAAVYLCAVLQGGSLGVAVYERCTNEISVLQTTEELKGAFAFQARAPRLLCFASSRMPQALFVSSPLPAFLSFYWPIP